MLNKLVAYNNYRLIVIVLRNSYKTQQMFTRLYMYKTLNHIMTLYRRKNPKCLIRSRELCLSV